VPKLSRIYYTQIIFLLCSVLYVLRRPDMLFNPQPWAEDGAVFISDHLSKGISAFIHNYAGYLHFFPRIFTFISVELSEILGAGLQLTPLIMNVLAITTSVLCVLYILSPSFDWLSSYKTRALSAIAIILIPTIPEVYGNATNLHWWLGVFQFLVTLHIWKWKKYPPLLISSLFLLSGLSGPSFFVAAFLIFLIISVNYFKVHHLSKRTLLFGLATLFVTLVQLTLSLIYRSISTENSPDFHGFMAYFPRAFFVGIFDRIFLWNFQEVVNYVLMPTSVLIGGIILLLLTYINLSRIRFFIFSILYIVLLMLITFIGANFIFGLYVDPFIDLGQRYLFIPVAIALILLFTSFNNKNRSTQIVYSFMCCVVSINMITNFQLDPFEDYKWREAVKNYSATSTNLCEVAINPPEWKMYIPCDTSETEVIEFVDSHNQILGYFDESHYDGTYLSGQGWAISPVTGKPADEVIITDSNHRILAHTWVKKKRPDVAEHFQDDNKLRSGWSFKAQVFGLTPEDKIFAYVYVPEEKKAYKLENDFSVVID